MPKVRRAPQAPRLVCFTGKGLQPQDSRLEIEEVGHQLQDPRRQLEIEEVERMGHQPIHLDQDLRQEQLVQSKRAHQPVH